MMDQTSLIKILLPSISCCIDCLEHHGYLKALIWFKYFLGMNVQPSANRFTHPLVVPDGKSFRGQISCLITLGGIFTAAITAKWPGFSDVAAQSQTVHHYWWPGRDWTVVAPGSPPTSLWSAQFTDNVIQNAALLLWKKYFGFLFSLKIHFLMSENLF